MLTEQQEKSIKEEAEREYPHETFGAAMLREAYIAAATKYQERINGLLEAAKEIDDYLSQELYEKGKPVHLNYVGAFSILHKNLKTALNESLKG